MLIAVNLIFQPKMQALNRAIVIIKVGRPVRQNVVTKPKHVMGPTPHKVQSLEALS